MPVIASSWDPSGMSFYVDGVQALHLKPVDDPSPVRRRDPEALDPAVFPNAVARLARASTLLGEMNNAVNAYWQVARWQWDIGPDPATGEIVFCLSMLNQLPPALPGIVADALNNMRGALNMLVMDLVRANGHATNRQHQFPTSSSEIAYRKDAPKRLSNVSTKARRFIDRLRPFQGANDLLWDLSRLRNTRDHDMVVPVTLAKLSLEMLAGMPMVFFGPDGTMSIGGGPPGSKPAGYERGLMSPGDAKEVVLNYGAAAELYRGPPGIAHIAFEPGVRLTINIGPDAGALDLLFDYHLHVSRIIAVAQRHLS